MDLIPNECINSATVVLCENPDMEKISWGLLTYDSTEKKYCFSEADNYDIVKSLMDTFWDRNSNLEVKMSEEEWNRRSAIINAIRNLISLIDNVEFYRSGFSMSHFTLETCEMVRVEDDEGSFDGVSPHTRDLSHELGGTTYVIVKL